MFEFFNRQAITNATEHQKSPESGYFFFGTPSKVGVLRDSHNSDSAVFACGHQRSTFAGSLVPSFPQ
jgi:hypothetical protein